MAAGPEKSLEELKNELSLLRGYPKSELIKIIKEVGFTCTCCGKCCTKEFNGHVFLLPEDVKNVPKEFLIPAPNFPYSDSDGNFYVEGYALKTKENGDCVYLSENQRCEIYENRFTICRLYPYMLHREADERGRVDWRQISGVDLHGEYHAEISESEAEKIADEIFLYETKFLEQQIAFHEAIIKIFSKRNEKFIRRDHDKRVREFLRGKTSRVFVYDDKFVEVQVESCRQI